MGSRPSDSGPRVGVLGGTGFVGSAVVRALIDRGFLVREITAPRIVQAPWKMDVQGYDPEVLLSLNDSLRDCTAVVNAAGVADSGAVSPDVVWGANAVLPGIVAAIGARHGIRAVHVSSAAVQGRKTILDASDDVDGFSLYARSKIAGENAVREANPEAVIFRPPGVHGPNRSVTRTISRLARSRLASVAAPGTNNSPQAQIDNVADAIAFLATTPLKPPFVVTHPSEQLSTASLMEALGGRRPILVPRPLALVTVNAAFATSRIIPRLSNQARRLEVLWFGQEQAPSWLTAARWKPPVGQSGWEKLRSSTDSL